MAGPSKITVTVEAHFSVPDDEARKCMRILEWWLEEHPDKIITTEWATGEGGKIRPALEAKAWRPM